MNRFRIGSYFPNHLQNGIGYSKKGDPSKTEAAETAVMLIFFGNPEWAGRD